MPELPPHVPRITLFAGATLPAPIRVVEGWPQIVAELLRIERRSRTPGIATLHEDLVKKTLPLFSPVTLKPGTSRADESVTAVHLAVVDIDKDDRRKDEKGKSLPVEFVQIDAVLAKLRERKLAYFLYTSWSHPDVEGVGGIKCRIVIPLSRAVLPIEWPRFWPRLNALVDGLADSNCKNISRAYFVPAASVSTEGVECEPFTENCDGECLDPDSLLALPASNVISLVERLKSPRKIKPRDLQDLVVRGKRSTQPEKRRLARALEAILAGESYAESGERDDVTFWLANRLVEELGNCDPVSLADLFAPSLQAMALEAAGAPTVEDVRRKIERVQSAQAEQKAKQEAENEDYLRVHVREAFEITDTPDRAHPYTEEELEAFVRDAGCSRAAFQDRWILQSSGLFYFYFNGGYTQAYDEKEGERTAQTFLSPAVRAGIQFVETDDKGNIRWKPLKQLVREYGRTVSSVQAEFGLERSWFDAPSGTLIEAVSPVRPIVPAYSEIVDKWLRLLGGSDIGYELLKDWITALTWQDRACKALYLEGEPGAGKSLFVEGLTRIWSKKGIVELDAAMGSFNEGITRCPLVFGDETVPENFKGQARIEELRRLITATHITLRRKYRKDTTVKGALRIVIAANSPDLFRTLDHMTKDEQNANLRRILHLKINSDAAGRFLASLRRVPDLKETDTVAAHALFLRDTHKFDSSHPLIVRDHEDEFHRRTPFETKLGGAVASWLVKFIQRPAGYNTAFKDKLVRIENGRLLVTAPGLADHWTTYETNYMPPPTVQQISRALKPMCEGEKPRLHCPNDKRFYFWVVNLLPLFEWAEEHLGTTAEDLRALLEAAEVTNAPVN